MQMQLKMKELELGQYIRLYKEKEETVSLVLLSVQNKFHFAKHIRFVLPFLEKEVDQYFYSMFKRLNCIELFITNTFI
jgi:hypothetical protein